MAATLSHEIVAFLIRAVLDGSVSRSTACSVVTPWVEGVSHIDPLTEDAAQFLHGIDIVVGADGLQRHESQGWVGRYVISDDVLRARGERWLDRLRAHRHGGRAAGPGS